MRIAIMNVPLLEKTSLIDSWWETKNVQFRYEKVVKYYDHNLLLGSSKKF